ncbi:Transcription termination factor mtef1 protein [Thalictrum thalictroides]|uniref:Transcription termination factor mtef1 protein n=1 Tax=Thalictrum thalictroides TaxID=46969 RepID=A0A7J6W1U2_THATH|nr:Transcription termination factor mtef1 protein [Thalictrum thalictroides]
MVHSLCIPTVSSSSSISRHNNKTPHKPSSSSSHPPLLIRFHTSHRENLRYLKTLNIITPTTTTSNNNFFSPETIDKILSLVNYFKSKGFSDSQIQKLALLNPKLFSSNLDSFDIDPIFKFLSLDVSASEEQSRELILRCPSILFSNVVYYLKPTLEFLRELGINKLNLGTSLNAHLLNTRVEKFVGKIRFLEGLGFTNEEARSVCGRLPAIFGYSIENNLRPKVKYLIEDMERSIDELKEFPQYFAFSLEKRIVPRHLHLKERNVYVPLRKMLLWSDQRFYAKWK